jgi:type I restriction enzyme S subunit
MSEVWELPRSWLMVTVAELGQVVSGGTPSTKEASFWGGNINWISPSDLTGYNKKYISKGAKCITEDGLKHSSAVMMPPGSIHFSSRAPIGYTVISSDQMSTNQGFKSLVPNQAVFNEYIYYYFKSVKQLAESKATGTTFKELSGAAFSKLPVPLPPISEQHRIVAKIEELFSELDKGIESLKTAREQIKVYRQALLKHAFEGKLTAEWREENKHRLESAEALLQRMKTERAECYQQQLAEWERAGKHGSKPKAPKELPPITPEELTELPELPEGWGWSRLGELTHLIAGHAFQKAEYSESGIRLFQIANVSFGEIIWEAVAYLPNHYWDDYPELRLFAGDLVIALNRPLLGDNLKIGRLGLSDTPAILYQRVGKFTTHNKNISDLIFWYLRSPNFITSLKNELRGINIPFINQTRLLEYPIPLCDISELTHIVDELTQIFSSIDQFDQTITQSLQQSEAMRQSILKKAFSGRLVPQDPNDEPASALLARIKAERAAPKAVQSSLFGNNKL